MNIVALTGKIAREIELKQVGEKTVALFAISVFNGKRDTEGRWMSDFFNVEAWDKTADNVVKYQSKGDFIELEGRIAMDTWKDKETGKTQSKFKIIANKIKGMGKSSGSTTTTRPVSRPAEDDEVDPFADD